MKRLRRSWKEFLDLIYQWLATVLMWASIASNFSHIQWYIEQAAVKIDWTSWAMAFVIEAGLGLSIHQFIQSLRAALLSRGQISKQDKRFNLAMIPVFLLAAAFLGGFSAICNAAFFGGDWLLGIVAPVLTGAFAILEATKELLAVRRGAGIQTVTASGRGDKKGIASARTVATRERTATASVQPVSMDSVRSMAEGNGQRRASARTVAETSQAMAGHLSAIRRTVADRVQQGGNGDFRRRDVERWQGISASQAKNVLRYGQDHGLVEMPRRGVYCFAEDNGL